MFAEAPRSLSEERVAELIELDVRSSPEFVFAIVGFAAETEDALANARAKLERKGADLLVVNDVGAGKGFEVADNAATILGRDGLRVDVAFGPKETLADAVWDAVVALL